MILNNSLDLPSEAISQICRARTFAETAHQSINQRRKYTGDAYIVHPESVAALVSGVIDDVEMISAAWLHDTVEDTPVTLDEISSEFGCRVARLVSDLTDVSRPEDGNRKIRKALDREHIRQASAEAKTIKLADLIDNAKSINQYDPKFAKIFMGEMLLMMAVLKEGDEVLYSMANELVKKYYYSE